MSAVFHGSALPHRGGPTRSTKRHADGAIAAAARYPQQQRSSAEERRAGIEAAACQGGPGRRQLLTHSLTAAGGAMLAAVSFPAPAALAEAAAEPTTAALATAAAAPVPAADTISQVLLSTLSDCQLAVSVYPTFAYDASGGGGTGSVERRDDGLLHLRFDAASLAIPPINARHAAILGIPVPPPLNISIVPRRLEGTLDPASGRVDLDFDASFEFSAGPLYHASPLSVATTLTSETSSGQLRAATGQRLQADGRARLVGVARVPPTDDPLLNTFLRLPTDALAVLSAELSFS